MTDLADQIYAFSQRADLTDGARTALLALTDEATRVQRLADAAEDIAKHARDMRIASRSGRDDILVDAACRVVGVQRELALL